jgi:nitrite reductase (NADH) small subunit
MEIENKKMRKWYPVAQLGEIPKKEGRRVYFGDHEFALFNLGDEYFATDNRCPHKQGPLADGILAGKAVFCPLHNWKISLETGCALSGGVGQVKVYPVKVKDDQIFIAFEDGELREPQGEAAAVSAESDVKDVGG